MTSSPPSQKVAKRRYQPPEVGASFVLKSYQLLEDQKFTDIVDWNEEGTAIVIKNPLEFGQTVLPTYFKHNNLTSFVRQLNMYNFRKRRTPTYDHVYHHELFIRGEKHLVKDIRRKTQDRGLSNIETAIQTLKNVQSRRKSDHMGGDLDENQMLKKLNEDAMNKIYLLEKQVQELTDQNKALWSKAQHQSQKQNLIASFVSEFMEKSNLSQEQFSALLNNHSRLPPLDLKDGVDDEETEASSYKQESIQTSSAMGNVMNIGDYLNFSERSRSTDPPTFSSHSKAQFSFSRGDFRNAIEGPEDWKFRFAPQVHEDPLEKRYFDQGWDEPEECRKTLKREDMDVDLKCDAFHLGVSLNLSNYEQAQDLKIEKNNSLSMGLYTSIDSFMNFDLGFSN